MWVYDGEEWVEDDGRNDAPANHPEPRPRYDEMMPELQVVEIVPVPLPRKSDLPPLPMPH